MEEGSNYAKAPPQSRPSPLNGVVPPIEGRFEPGKSGNPGGRPKVKRTVSAALAELQDTVGQTPDECVERFRRSRGDELCASDHKAIALFRAEMDVGGRTQVSAIETALDRLEGKVPSTTVLSGADGGPLRVEWVNDWRKMGGEG